MGVAIKTRKSEREGREKQRGRWSLVFVSFLSCRRRRRTRSREGELHAFQRRCLSLLRTASRALLGPVDALQPRVQSALDAEKSSAPLPAALKASQRPRRRARTSTRERESKKKAKKDGKKKNSPSLSLPLTVFSFRPAPRVSGSGAGPRRGSRGRAKASGTGSDEHKEKKSCVSRETPRFATARGAEVDLLGKKKRKK